MIDIGRNFLNVSADVQWYMMWVSSPLEAFKQKLDGYLSECLVDPALSMELD